MVFFIGWIFKITNNKYFVNFENKLTNFIGDTLKSFNIIENLDSNTESPTDFFVTETNTKQEIYPASINYDAHIEITPKNFDPSLNSHYLTNLNNRISQIIQKSPVNMDKYVSFFKEYFEVSSEEIEQIIRYIKKQIEGDDIGHKIQITNTYDDVNKVLYANKFYIYEFKFAANYFTNHISKKKLDKFIFVCEIVFTVEIMAFPSKKNTLFVSPLNISNKHYDLNINKLFISGLQPRNNLLPGYDNDNNKQFYTVKETIHPSNATLVNSSYSIDYDSVIGSAMPSSLND